MASDGPLTKKIRIWNPALNENNQEESRSDESSTNTPERDTSEEKPIDFSKNTQFQIPEVFQNYLQLAPLMLRLQQQRQMEELARRQLLSTLVVPPRTTVVPETKIVTKPVILPQQPSVSINNPIVANALGSPMVNENCCAVCGAVFRLTGDLVQHMRNNHRKSKFKRKADSRQ